MPNITEYNVKETAEGLTAYMRPIKQNMCALLVISQRWLPCY